MSEYLKQFKTNIRSKILGVALLLSSCQSGPRANPLELPISILQKTVKEAQQSDLFDSTRQLTTTWWTLFADAQLTALIEKTLTRHPTLQTARAKIFLAGYRADQFRSTLFPSIGLAGDLLRQKFSQTGLIPFNASTPIPTTTTTGSSLPATGGAAGIPLYFTQYETELTLSYEFDLWGKNRNLLRAAIGEVRASEADEVFVRLQLGITVAQLYYQLQVAYQRLEIAKSLVSNQTLYRQLIQTRIKNNVGNAITLKQVEMTLSSFRESLLEIEGEIAVKEYQLKAYLAADFEESIEQIELDHQSLPRLPLPSCLPLHLIANRPDIKAQLWLIESAGRQIAVAKAGFYPDINLSALFGFQTLNFAKLLTWPSSYFSVNPAFSLPIFDGGRLTANLRSSEVNYDLAIFRYNDLVLNAVKEVLEGLAILQNAQAQYRELNKSFHLQQELAQLTALRVKAHLNSDLDLLNSQKVVLQMQERQLIAYGQTFQSLLSLIKALGGGYAIESHVAEEATNQRDEKNCYED